MTGQITRERVTWIRWDDRTLRTLISHPHQWRHTDADGYVRSFDTRDEAERCAAADTRERNLAAWAAAE